MQYPVSHPLLRVERSDGRFLRIAFLCALTAHVAVLVMPWKKEPHVPEPPPVRESIPVTWHDIEPPKLPDRTVVETVAGERRIPVPSHDPEPEMLQPVDEQVAPDLPALPDGEADLILGEGAAPPAPRVYDSRDRDLVLPVRLPGSIDPEYPELGVASRTGGIVILEAVIDEQGRVVDLQLLRAPVPDPGFSRSALDAVAAWRYSPGTVNGRPVTVRMSVRVEFSLQ